MSDDLRQLWDFGDLDGTERRFEECLGDTQDDGLRAELLTQLARVAGLRGEFERGEQLLVDAEGLARASARAQVRIDLERGRLLRSDGDRGAALPLFVAACESAIEDGELFIAADAAHMAAVAAPFPEDRLRWTECGIALAESDDEARYWLGPLLNNLGWDRYDAGEHELALDAFERALAHRERNPEDGEAIAIACYAVARAEQALGRHENAAAELERAIAWTESVEAPDGWFHEALAESSAALGRDQEARRNARLALSLLPDTDPSFADDAARVGRLRELAGS